MSSDFATLPIKAFPLPPGRRTSEGRYWKKFKSPVLLREYGPVSSIAFSPVAPHDFAVTSASRVQVYSATTHVVKKTISRFKDTAYSGSIRSDGKLLVAGDASGLVQLFDLSSRAILRTLRGHDEPVHVTGFSPNPNHLLSAADDALVKLWDIPSEAPLLNFTAHTDYVRSGLIAPDAPHLILSGSYDHTAKLWDSRAGTAPVLSMHHGLPVEAVLLFPGNGLAVSAGGNSLKIWDILAGGRCIQTLSNHQKTITALSFDGRASRIITGSLDHNVKVYDVQDYKVTHNFKYSAPILSLALSPDDTHLCVGMSNGILSVRQRIVKTEDLPMAQKDSSPKGNTYQYFIRGKHHQASPDELQVGSRRTGKKLTNYDKALKAFQYGKALDLALGTSHKPVVKYSLLEELVRREGLSIALAGRDDVALEPLVRFTSNYLTNPKFTNLLVDVANLILDMYGDLLGHSPLIDELVVKLQTRIRNEIALQQSLTQMVGSLDMIFSNAHTNSLAKEE